MPIPSPVVRPDVRATMLASPDIALSMFFNEVAMPLFVDRALSAYFSSIDSDLAIESDLAVLSPNTLPVP